MSDGLAKLIGKLFGSNLAGAKAHESQADEALEGDASLAPPPPPLPAPTPAPKKLFP